MPAGPPGRLAPLIAELAPQVEAIVLQRPDMRAERALEALLKPHRDLAASDRRVAHESIAALFRWRGWVDPLNLERIEARLLVSTLLDRPAVPPVCRVWARTVGANPSRLFALGDAPDWPARASEFRKLLDQRVVTTDPWKLFPDWIKQVLPVPPGDDAPKHRYVRFLQTLQSQPPFWVRALRDPPDPIWKELHAQGIKPWVHRRWKSAARLDPDLDFPRLPPVERGELVEQDLASQTVGIVCAPRPGERWWDVSAGSGVTALQLASLLRGKGQVVATDQSQANLDGIVRRVRKTPFSNLSTKLWDGKRTVGKPESYQGVVVNAASSDIGEWGRHPDARWTLKRQDISAFAGQQSQMLQVAASGVRPGGVLIYSVATVTTAETRAVVQAFLSQHSEFRLDPFPHPFEDQSTDGMLLLWPQEHNTDSRFFARMIRAESSRSE